MATKTKQRYEGERDRQFNFGDLVKLAGYGDNIWAVDGYVHTHYRFPNEEWTELEYELVCVYAVGDHGVEVGHGAGGYEEEMTLCARADGADDYLKRLARRNRARKPQAVVVDGLLAELNDYMALERMFGGGYDDEISRIKRKLKRALSKNK